MIDQMKYNNYVRACCGIGSNGGDIYCISIHSCLDNHSLMTVPPDNLKLGSLVRIEDDKRLFYKG